LHDRAISLNPNLALAWGFSGLALTYLGEHEDALIRVRQAVRMSPSDPHSFFFDTAMMLPYLLLGQYEKAAEFGRRALELNPGFSSGYRVYLSVLGHLGRTHEAAKARARLATLESEVSLANAVSRSPLTRPQDRERFAEGLRRAGFV
jgi:tetratricopeptide (TPR) repeat protein